MDNFPPNPGDPVLRMFVDPSTNRGYSVANFVEKGKPSQPSVIIYDLEHLTMVDRVQIPPGYEGILGQDQLASIDTLHHRLFFPINTYDAAAAGCPDGAPNPTIGIGLFDIAAKSWSKIPVPCTSALQTNASVQSGLFDLLPGGGLDQFYVQGLAYYAPTNKIHLIGAAQSDKVARGNVLVLDNKYAQTILIRQMDFASRKIDWEVDVRYLGCDAVQDIVHPPFIGRYGDNVFSYCYAVQDSPEGLQGYALRIPLDNERPRAGSDGRADIRRTATLPNFLYPILDPGSGRILLLTSDAESANGDAVWAYDGANERFFGVIASGVVGAAGVSGATTYAGLNPETGRTYLMTSAGMLVADARHSPLPAGLSYPVLREVRRQNPGPFIAVAPRLHRLFVPVKGRGFVVLRDDVPEPPPPPDVDPDSGTADIPEVPGKTSSVYSGAGTAFGLHALVTGGIPRIINNRDPFCVGTVAVFVNDKDDLGRCAADQILTSGNRELFLAATEVELGSETGAGAEATGGAFSNKDSATDADFKRLGSCEAELISSKTGELAAKIGQPPPESPPDAYTEFCAGSKLSIFGGGTRGTDGKGFPIPLSACEDFGEKPTSGYQLRTADGLPWHSMASSSVVCNAKRGFSHAESATNGFAWPDPTKPLISVSRTTSESTTQLTGEGTITTIKAEANGIRIGDVSIGRVTSTATTVAHGRSGSTDARFTRGINQVHGAGIDCDKCDYQTVIDQLNQALGLRLNFSTPGAEEIKTPKGYQAIVIKDSATRDSDRAVNDDDTYTVPGLQVVFYNDGKEGRSRLVLQLAGVQAESRYGIFLLPQEAEGGTEVLGGRITGPADFDLDGALGGGVVESVVEQVAEAVAQAVAYPVAAAADAVRLIVTNPREFGVLFVMWSLLGSPLYLGLRRRSFARGLGL